MQRILKQVRQYLESLKRGDRKISKDGMLIVFLMGILLYVISLPTNNNSSYSNKSRSTQEALEDSAEKLAQTQAEYCKELEKRLEEFLSQVEGVGQVKAIIYMDTSDTYVVEKDTPVYETASSDEGKTATESKREETTVYTTNEYGEQVPFITQTRMPAIEGLVIAAQGADDENIRVQLTRMAMALYGIEANKVEVLCLREN